MRGVPLAGEALGFGDLGLVLAVETVALRSDVDCTLQRNARSFLTAGTSVLSEHQLNCFPDGSSTPPTTKDRYNLLGSPELELQDFD